MKTTYKIIKDFMTWERGPETIGYYRAVLDAARLTWLLKPKLNDKNESAAEMRADEELKHAPSMSPSLQELKDAGVIQ